MIELDSINVENLVVFKKTKFKIKPGISVIRGLNKDSKATKSANAVGKTLLFATIPTMLLHSPPMADKKNSASSFLPDKANVNLLFKVRQQAINLQQFMRGKSIQYKITINGKDQNVRTVTQMREAVSNLIPTTDTIFYSTVMVSSFRPPLLWLGTSAQRYDFFEEVADLGYYDIMAAKISKKISEIKVQEKVIVPWEAELAELKNLYHGPKQIKDLKLQIKKLQKQKKETEKTLKNLQHKAAKFEVISNFATPLNKLLKYGNPKKYNKLVKNLHHKLTTAHAKVKALHERYKKLVSEQEARTKFIEWKKQVKKLKPKMSLAELHKRLKKTQKTLDEIIDAQTTVREFSKEIKLYVKYKLHNLKGKQPAPSDIKNLERKIEGLKAYDDLRARYYKEGTCPVCFNKSKAKDHKHKNPITDLVSQLKTMKMLQVKYKVEAPYVQECMQLIKTAKDNKDKVASLLAQISNAEKYDLLMQNEPRKPEMVNKVEIKQLRKNIRKRKLVFDKLRDAFNKVTHDDVKLAYKTVAAHYGDTIGITNLMLKIKLSRGLYEKASNAHNRIVDDIISLKTALQAAKQARKTYRALNKKYKEATAKIAELADWQTLHKAFSPTGMRVQHMQHLVNGYIKYMNNLASLVYSEPMVFSAKLEGRNFNLDVTRHGKPSDVRYLSGAQARLFMAISAVSLRKMLPTDKVFSMIIFDEIDANVSTGELAKFSTDFLEYLQDEIPSIIIVTPKTSQEWLIPNATDHIFVREGGFTTIHDNDNLRMAA